MLFYNLCMCVCAYVWENRTVLGSGGDEGTGPNKKSLLKQEMKTTLYYSRFFILLYITYTHTYTD